MIYTILKVFQNWKITALKLFLNTSILQSYYWLFQPTESEILSVVEICKDYGNDDINALWHIVEIYNRNDGIMQNVIAKMPWAFVCASENIRGNRNLVLKLLRKHKRAGIFNFVTESLRDDEEVVKIAMQHGADLSVASDRLRDNIDIVLLGIENWLLSIAFASDRIKNNPALIQIAIDKYPELPDILNRLK